MSWSTSRRHLVSPLFGQTPKIISQKPSSESVKKTNRGVLGGERGDLGGATDGGGGGAWRGNAWEVGGKPGTNFSKALGRKRRTSTMGYKVLSLTQPMPAILVFCSLPGL